MKMSHVRFAARCLSLVKSSSASAAPIIPSFQHATNIIQQFGELQVVRAVCGEPRRVFAYRNAISSLEKYVAEKGDDVRDASELTGIPSFGPSLCKKGKEIIETGSLRELELARTDPAIAIPRKLMEVHGFGPVKAVEIYQKHNICSVEELRERAPEIPGLTAAQRTSLQYFGDTSQRIPFAEVQKHEAYLLNAAKGLSLQAQICGSYRRKRPDCGDIDCLLTPASTQKKFCDYEKLEQFVHQLGKRVVASLGCGSTKFMGLVRLEEGQPVRRLDVRVVPRASWAPALLYFTGSKLFNIRMRIQALSRGFTLNEYALNTLGGNGKKKNSSGPREDGGRHL